MSKIDSSLFGLGLPVGLPVGLLGPGREGWYYHCSPPPPQSPFLEDATKWICSPPEVPVLAASIDVEISLL